MSEIINDIWSIVLAISLAVIAITIGTHLIFDYDYSIVPIGLIFYSLAGILLNTVHETITNKQG